MKNELTILIEKFLRRQTSSDEVFRLKELLMQVDAEDILSDLYDKKWEQATFSPEIEVEDRIWSKLQKQIHQPEPVALLPSVEKYSLWKWKKNLRIAVSILIPLLCAGLWYFYSGNKSRLHNDKMTVQVEIGQKAKMQLPDGTYVWLNSASSLTYDNTYNRKERTVYLEGEAYFEVSRDKARPFIVKANDLSIEALGTNFDVKAYPDDNYIAATLIEGSIRISSPSQSEVLKPDEKLIVAKGSGQFTKKVLLDVEKSTSWINNQLAFEQERLEDIAKILERMYNIQVHFASDKLKNIRFSGTVKNNSLDDIMQLIAFVSPICYSRENDSTIVIRSK